MATKKTTVKKTKTTKTKVKQKLNTDDIILSKISETEANVRPDAKIILFSNVSEVTTYLNNDTVKRYVLTPYLPDAIKTVVKDIAGDEYGDRKDSKDAIKKSETIFINSAGLILLKLGINTDYEVTKITYLYSFNESSYTLRVNEKVWTNNFAKKLPKEYYDGEVDGYHFIKINWFPATLMRLQLDKKNHKFTSLQYFLLRNNLCNSAGYIPNKKLPDIDNVLSKKKLYLWPFWNSYSSGSICLGNTITPRTINANIMRSFLFQTAANGDIGSLSTNPLDLVLTLNEKDIDKRNKCFDMLKFTTGVDV